MKELNKIFYDILLKLNDEKDNFSMNKKLIIKYFKELYNNDEKCSEFGEYFNAFYNFCFDKQSINMIKEVQNYRF